MSDPIDLRFMDLAFRAGERQLGRTGDNPAVGCVIVRDGVVLGLGATCDGGRPHAEVSALSLIADAAGATAYVTLEPCAHFGKSPPCANALIKAKISRVVCPFLDPDPRVAGLGFAMLRGAGIEVIHPKITAIPAALRPFFTARMLSRAHITLKSATSMDGKIALGNGQSQWISGEKTREYTRALRAKFDAIIVGIRTVLADDPQLDIRAIGFENHAPRPVILDRLCRTPLGAKIRARNPIIFHSTQSTPTKELAANANCIAIMPDENNQLPILEIAKRLSELGLNSALIEGGASVAASALQAGIVDQILHIASNTIIGGDGISAIADLHHENIKDISRFKRDHSLQIGEDLITQYSFEHLDLSALTPK